MSDPRAILSGFCLVLLGAAAPIHGETGYDLWLRYASVTDAPARAAHRQSVSALVVPGRSATTRVTRDEARRGLKGLLGADPAIWDEVRGPGALLVGTPSTSPDIAALGLTENLRALGP